MMEKNLKRLLDILENALNNDGFKEDVQNIQYLCDAIKLFQKEMPAIDELEKAKKIEVDLEVKYEEFYELNNYFDPMYIELKKQIHACEVKKIREANRKKREGK